MSITVSYNKNVGVHYVYETEYVFDPEKNKKVQRSRCIGHLDPVTQEIVPNGKRGRPRIDPEKAKEEAEEAKKKAAEEASQTASSYSITDKDFAALLASVQHIDRTLTQLIRNLRKLSERMDPAPSARKTEAEDLEEN